MNDIKYVNANSIRLTTPDYVSIEGVNYFIKSKHLKSRIIHGLGLRNVSFCKTLYEIDKSTWEAMLNKLSNSESVIDFKNSKTAVVKDGEIIGLAGSSRIEELIKVCESLAENLESEIKIEYLNDWIYITMVDNNDVGLLIIYYPDWDWITVRSTVKVKDDVYINPYTIVSTEMEEEDSSFAELLNVDVLRTHLDKDTLIEYHYNEFERIANTADVSIGEIRRLLKSQLGIKYKEGLSAFDIAAENSDFDATATSLLTNIFSSIDRFQKVALYAPDLRREITFSTPAIEYYKLLSNLAKKSVKYYEQLWQFIEIVLGKHLNYSQLNDVEEMEDSINEA